MKEKKGLDKRHLASSFYLISHYVMKSCIFPCLKICKFSTQEYCEGKSASRADLHIHFTFKKKNKSIYSCSHVYYFSFRLVVASVLSMAFYSRGHSVCFSPEIKARTLSVVEPQKGSGCFRSEVCVKHWNNKKKRIPRLTFLFLLFLSCVPFFCCCFVFLIMSS